MLRSILTCAVVLSFALAACSDDSDGRKGPVAISPSSVSLRAGDQQRFTATVRGRVDAPVAWSVREGEAGGRIDESGLYVAPERPGTYHVVATSIEEPGLSGTAEVRVRARPPEVPVDMSIVPEDRRRRWSPGIPGGIPQQRQVFATLADLPKGGVGDASAAINQAIRDAHQAYLQSGVIQEVVLPEGTFRLGQTVMLSRSGVVLRGQGMDRTRLRYDGQQRAIHFGRALWGTYTAKHGPFDLVADAHQGTREIVLSSRDAAGIEPGDILCIDEEDDPSYVRMGDARFEKRQPTADTHGPALREPGAWRSVTSLIRVVGKTEEGENTRLELADPLHMDFRVARRAQVFHTATEATREPFEGVHWVGLEDLYVTGGGGISTNNVAFCWIRNVEVDGNPGTELEGEYENPGGITGRNVDLFHAYRCEVRGSYIHHSRNISQGGGAYLLSISSYTSETLIEDNIVVYGNKLIVGNMMGGGNVIAYNYVDNARTYHESWQEGAIDLNHQSFTHSALVEGNWSTNLVSDTTHGNAGWHVFFRNVGTGQNGDPIYGPYPYIGGQPDGAFRRAAGTDGYHREATYIGNVLLVGPGEPVYQVDHTTGARMGAAAVWRIGWGTDGYGDRTDDGTALAHLYRHANWDAVTGGIVWDEANAVRKIPPSLYLTSKPAFFGDEEWPWVDPTAESEEGRIKVLPAKARWDAMQR